MPLTQAHYDAWLASAARAGRYRRYGTAPSEASLWYGSKTGWIPVREVDPATGQWVEQDY